MKSPLLLLLSACISYSAFCQNIGVGTTAPKNKLHIAGGLRVDTLANGADSGILRHDKNGVVYRLKFTGNSSDVLRGNGTFGPAGVASSGWMLTGNAGTNPGTNFIGTTDAQPLKFRLNNQPAGVLDPVNYNVSLGYLTLSNTTGSYNTAVGSQSLSANTNGASNSAFGADVLSFNTSGGFNTAVGASSLYFNTVGGANVAIGIEALYSNSSGSRNAAIGINALHANTTGFENTASGFSVMQNNTSGFLNTAYGREALASNTVGYNNTAIGAFADVSKNDLWNATAIGALAKVDCSNCLVLGGGGINVGIGTSNPKTKLHTTGSLRFDTLSNNIDSGLLRHDKNGVVYRLKFTGNSSDVLRGNGSFGPAGAAASGWALIGNSGTNPANNFVGTTDNQPLRFRINNISAGELDPTLRNTFFGLRAGQANTTGHNNVAIGTDALKLNTDISNLVAVGDSALFNNIGGGGNLGIRNTAIGTKALYTNKVGQSNTAIGFRSLYLNDGTDNTASGMFTLLNNTSGSSNTAFGSAAFLGNTTGSGNTALGAGANVLSGNLENATAIGYHAEVGASNSMALGGTAANAVKVGIGVTSPIVTLHVKGTANIFSGADTHTGNFFNGTSSVDGIEMVSSGADAYMSVQRTAGGYGLHITKKNTLNNNGLVGFLVNDILVGAITTNGTTTTYYSSPSDARLKENIHPTQFGLSNLMKITVADYNYKADDAKNLQTGFIAQDLYKLYPQAVQSGGENEKTNPWMIDYSKITPLLVKSIQQQQQIIENQKNEIDILKTQVTDLINAVNTLKNK